jgi:DNA polymerase III alpha subunit
MLACCARLRPRCYYDLAIQVTIVRPGPITGGMVHPYLRRHKGEEAVDYPSPAIQHVLQRTLGVTIFQDQVIQIAMDAAGIVTCHQRPATASRVVFVTLEAETGTINVVAWSALLERQRTAPRIPRADRCKDKARPFEGRHFLCQRVWCSARMRGLSSTNAQELNQP